MKALPYDKIKEYIKGRGYVCPFCGEEAVIEDHHRHPYRGDIELSAECVNCHETWLNVYVLSEVQGIEIDDAGDSHTLPAHWDHH